MRMQAQTIALGDQAWLVRPLTVAQVQGIEPLLLASAESKAGSVAAALAILRVALARDHAEAATRLDEIEAGAPEIAVAMGQVLRLGGFLPHGDMTPGEVEAGPTPAASTGVASTPA